MKNEITVHFKTKGAEKMTKQLQMLQKGIESFFATGKKFKIPKQLLMKMLKWQVDRKKTTRPVKL